MQTVKVVLTPEQAAQIKTRTKRIWDNYAIIGEVQKSSRIKFVIAAGVRDGVRYINIREFYLRKKDQLWKPGRDGITIPLRIPVDDGTKIIEPYGDFIQLLAQTKEALEVMALFDADNAVVLED